MRNTTVQNGWRVALPKCAIAVAMLCLAHAADAGFVISSSRYADGSDDVVVFRALNDGMGSQAGTMKVGSENITVTSKVSALIFDLTLDRDGDGVKDSNVFGINDDYPTSAASTMPLGSFIRLGALAASEGNFTCPTYTGGVTPVPYSMNGANPTANYTNLFSFNVQGTILSSGVVANSTPAAFALAVVPAGTEVDFSGTLTAEQGASVPVSGSNLAPEPATASLLLAAACVIGMGRRRKNTSTP